MQRALEQLSKKGLAAAARETLTQLAFHGRRIWQEELAQAHTLRNTYTQRRVLVVPARGSSLRSMEAVLGHPEQFVADLEYGKESTPKGSSTAVGTPTLGARTGGDKAKLVARPNRLASIGKLPAKKRGNSWKARNARALRAAVKAGQKIVFLESSRSRGLYRIGGGRKKLKMKKLWDITHRTVKRPKRPTLQRSIDAAVQFGPAVAERAMQKQLDLLKVT